RGACPAAALTAPLALDDANRPHPGDLARQPRLVDDLDHVVHVLVRLGLLLREPPAALGPGDDALGLQLLVDLAAAGLGDGGGAAHGPAGAVAGGAERPLHAARLAHQHPAGPAHVAGDDDRLADLAVHRRHLRVVRREGPRRPLAVDPDLFLLAVDRVL